MPRVRTMAALARIDADGQASSFEFPLMLAPAVVPVSHAGLALPVDPQDGPEADPLGGADAPGH